MNGSYLGIDYGTKHIGLALSDPDAVIVSPLKTIDTAATMEDTARAILAAVCDYDLAGIVIGLPLNMDGTEGSQAKLSKQLAEAIRQVGGPPVYLHDERLTSHAADKLLAGSELTHKKKKRRHDAVAAQVLLQSFLESKRMQDE